MRRARTTARRACRRRSQDPPESERERVEQLLARKYWIDRFTVYPLYSLVTRLRGGGSRTNEAPVALEITTRWRRSDGRK
jgi:hypothetical protein